jgi:hypothetical protein
MKLTAKSYYTFSLAFRGMLLVLMLIGAFGYGLFCCSWVELTDPTTAIHEAVEKASQEARNVDENGETKEMAQREE